MTHAIHPTLFMRNFMKSLAFLLIIKLKQYPMIFQCHWIKKYGVLLDIIHDSIIFFSGFCMYLKNSLSFISSKLIEEIKKISKAKQQQDITLKLLLKSESRFTNPLYIKSFIKYK